jgi:hypothetical protein
VLTRSIEVSKATSHSVATVARSIENYVDKILFKAYNLLPERGEKREKYILYAGMKTPRSRAWNRAIIT